MAWKVDFTQAAARQFKKLDRTTAERIAKYLKNLVKDCEHPDQRGKALTANMAGLWRYRIGDYRVVCELQDAQLLVLVVRVAHRCETYRDTP